MKREQRVLVVKQADLPLLLRRKRSMDLKFLAESALEMATSLYRKPGNPHLTPEHMAFYLALLMAASDLQLPADTLMQDMKRYEKEIAFMRSFLLEAWEPMGFAIPERFPYTLAELRER